MAWWRVSGIAQWRCRRGQVSAVVQRNSRDGDAGDVEQLSELGLGVFAGRVQRQQVLALRGRELGLLAFEFALDRKSTRLNSSHVAISYAVFCLKKKNRECTATQATAN